MANKITGKGFAAVIAALAVSAYAFLKIEDAPSRKKGMDALVRENNQRAAKNKNSKSSAEEEKE